MINIMPIFNKKILYLFFLFLSSCGTTNNIKEKHVETSSIKINTNKDVILLQRNSCKKISFWREKIEAHTSNDTIIFDFFRNNDMLSSKIYLKSQDKNFSYLLKRGILYPDLFAGSIFSPITICCFEKLTSSENEKMLKLRFWIFKEKSMNPTSYIVSIESSISFKDQNLQDFLSNITDVYLYNEGIII